MKVSLITPSGSLFRNKEAEFVEFPTPKGYIGVLPGHLPTIGLLSMGILKLKLGNKEEKYALEDGFFEIEEDTITLLAKVAYTPMELKRGELEEEKEKAFKVLKESTSPEEVELAAKKYTRASVFLTIAQG